MSTGGIVFVGCVEIGRQCLEEVLACGGDVRAVVSLAPETATRTSGYVRFDDLGIPVHFVRTINAPESVAVLRALAPDLVLVIGWQELLGDAVLDVPRHGTVGMHASLLPRYRGRAPVNWAIINGETETGITMLHLSARADAGDIIAQRAFPIENDDTCATVYGKAAAAGRAMLREYLPRLVAGTAPRMRQRVLEPAMPRRRPEDGVIDWTRSCRALHDWVRALTHPYPGAFTFAGSRRVSVWTARPCPAAPVNAAPGTVLEADSRGLLVATGDGALLVTAYEVAGDAAPAIGVGMALGSGTLAVADSVR